MIEKILKWFAKIPADKLLHSYLVLVISLIVYDILELFLPMLWSIILTTLIATAIMVWKEWYDSKHNCTHTVEDIKKWCEEWIAQRYINSYENMLSQLKAAEKRHDWFIEKGYGQIDLKEGVDGQ